MKEALRQELLAAIAAEEGQTTAELAEKIARSRSVTSLYLNELLRMGRIRKTSGRPVRWQRQTGELKSSTAGVFDQFVGANGSLAVAVNQIQSAMLYPPMGMPLLLHGHSGVGKTYLAQVIADFLKENQAPNAEKIITFNCADYAHNPELLSSILFGYVKGAFTGADRDSQGLLAQADHGILFLDEIHRLSFENQEKLFQFIDRGYFHRLGDEKTTIHAQVRLLFATTEDPKQVLLPTFYRRIPLTVELVDFAERPRLERMLLVGKLLQQEAQLIHRPLAIEATILSQIVDAQYVGNIGGLKNRLKLLCATSLRQEDTPKDVLVIKEDSDTAGVTIPIEALLQVETIVSNERDQIAGVWRDLLEKEDFLRAQALLQRAVETWQAETLTIQQQWRQQEVCDLLKRRWWQKFGQAKDWQAPALAIAMACEVADTSLEDQFRERLQQLQFEYPRTTALAYQLLKASDYAKVYNHVALTLSLLQHVSEAVRYQGLLVAHGDSTASSMQMVVNQLLDDYIFDAIDMPLDASVADIVTQTKAWLNERETEAGVIMMVDMGSLTQLYQQLKPQIHGQLLVINHLTTAYALELGQMIQRNAPFSAIAEQMEQLPTPDVQYFEGFALTPNVIISSLSGDEITARLADIFVKYLYPQIKVIPLAFNDLMQAVDQTLQDESYLASTELIITTGATNLPEQLKTLNVMDLIGDQHDPLLPEKLAGLMRLENNESLVNDLLHFFSEEGLKEKLTFLNPEIIISQVEQVVEKIERRFQYGLAPEMKFMLMMHLAVMVERMMLSGDSYDLPVDPETLGFNHKPFFPTMHSILHDIEQFYRVTTNDWEIYILYEILQGMRH